MIKVLVTGASGTLGRLLVNRLVERGHEVRGLVRPGRRDRSAPVPRSEVKLIPGDYKDETSLQAALEGVEVVITAVRAGLYDKPAQHYGLEVAGNRRLFRLAVGAGVKHLTYISLMHAEKFPRNHIFNAKHQAENILKESGLAYTILRPGALMSREMLARSLSGLSKGYFTPVEGEKMPHSPMLYNDLAEFCIRAFEVPAVHSRSFNIGGPVVYRGSEWVRDLATAFGLPFRTRPQNSFLTSMMVRLVQPESRFAREYIAIKTLNDFSVDPVEMEELAGLFGTKLHHFEDYYPPVLN